MKSGPRFYAAQIQSKGPFGLGDLVGPQSFEDIGARNATCIAEEREASSLA